MKLQLAGNTSEISWMQEEYQFAEKRALELEVTIFARKTEYGPFSAGFLS